MVHIFLLGHGNFATGLASCAKTIVGDVEALHTFDLTPETSPSDFEADFTKALKSVPSSDGVFCLCDIMGATPFKVAVINTKRNEKAFIMGGSSMPMLLELIEQREESDNLESIVEEIRRAGHEGIFLWKGEAAGRGAGTGDEVPEDGI